MPALLAELSPEQFGLWRQHPVTKLVFDDYMLHFRQSLERAVIQSWLGGKLSLQIEQEARGYIHASHLVQNLSLSAIKAFYGLAEVREPFTGEPRPRRDGWR